jgi:hypothetical protein
MPPRQSTGGLETIGTGELLNVWPWAARKYVLKPHLEEQWVIPPAANAAFVAAMEKTFWRFI